MAQKAQGLAGVDAKGAGGRLGMAGALGSPDLGTEIEKQDGWVGTALGPLPACSRPLLLPPFLREVILALELQILAVRDAGAPGWPHSCSQSRGGSCVWEQGWWDVACRPSLLGPWTL